MNIQRHLNILDETARTQMNQLVDAVRGEQQKQFLELFTLFMQNGNLVENAQRMLPHLHGVDMSFIHNLNKKLKDYSEWYVRKVGLAPLSEPVPQTEPAVNPPKAKAK